jgi:hypothetical protein
MEAYSMSTAPLITIFVRHSGDCKYKGDEFARRCQCKKHFRWTQNGTQYRRTAGTRSWADAEQTKRDLEDQLAGRRLEPKPDDAHFLQKSIDVFFQDKKVQEKLAYTIAEAAAVTGFRQTITRLL